MLLLAWLGIYLLLLGGCKKEFFDGEVDLTQTTVSTRATSYTLNSNVRILNPLSVSDGRVSKTNSSLLIEKSYSLTDSIRVGDVVMTPLFTPRDDIICRRVISVSDLGGKMSYETRTATLEEQFDDYYFNFSDGFFRDPTSHTGRFLQTGDSCYILPYPLSLTEASDVLAPQLNALFNAAETGIKSFIKNTVQPDYEPIVDANAVIDVEGTVSLLDLDQDALSFSGVRIDNFRIKEFKLTGKLGISSKSDIQAELQGVDDLIDGIFTNSPEKTLNEKMQDDIVKSFLNAHKGTTASPGWTSFIDYLPAFESLPYQIYVPIKTPLIAVEIDLVIVPIFSMASEGYIQFELNLPMTSAVTLEMISTENGLGEVRILDGSDQELSETDFMSLFDPDIKSLIGTNETIEVGLGLGIGGAVGGEANSSALVIGGTIATSLSASVSAIAGMDVVDLYAEYQSEGFGVNLFDGNGIFLEGCFDPKFKVKPYVFHDANVAGASFLNSFLDVSVPVFATEYSLWPWISGETTTQYASDDQIVHQKLCWPDNCANIDLSRSYVDIYQTETPGSAAVVFGVYTHESSSLNSSQQETYKMEFGGQTATVSYNMESMLTLSGLDLLEDLLDDLTGVPAKITDTHQNCSIEIGARFLQNCIDPSIMDVNTSETVVLDFVKLPSDLLNQPTTYDPLEAVFRRALGSDFTLDYLSFIDAGTYCSVQGGRLPRAGEVNALRDLNNCLLPSGYILPVDPSITNLINTAGIHPLSSTSSDIIFSRQISFWWLDDGSLESGTLDLLGGTSNTYLPPIDTYAPCLCVFPK